MPYKLIPPGERDNPDFYYVRGSVAKRRFEVSTGKKTRAEAESWAIDYVQELQSDPSLIDKPIVSYEDAARAYMAFKVPSETEKERHEKLIVYFNDQNNVAVIKHTHLIAAANTLYPNGSPGTKNREVISPAAAVLHYAYDQEWCAYRRFKRFKEPKYSNKKPARNEDVALLMANCTGRRRLFLAVTYETGLRLSDVLSIDSTVVDLQAAELLVDVGKNGERVALSLSPSLVAAIANEGFLPGGRLFPWTTKSGVYKWLTPLRERLGVSYTPHRSRHALATDLHRQKVPDKAAMNAGAWLDVDSLRRYQHVDATDLPVRDVGELWGKTKASS